MRLGMARVGNSVRLVGMRKENTATVVTINSGSVTLITNPLGKRVQWSPDTQVEIVDPACPRYFDHVICGFETAENTPENTPETPVKATKQKTRQTVHPDKPKAETPAKKAPKGKDIFGVTNGSQAAQANVVLLKIKKNVTIEMVVAENSSLIRNNVRSHFDRMAKDGLIDVKAKDTIRYYSIKKGKK